MDPRFLYGNRSCKESFFMSCLYFINGQVCLPYVYGLPLVVFFLQTVCNVQIDSNYIVYHMFYEDLC